MTSTLLPQIVNGDELFDRYAAAVAGQEVDHVLRLWAYATLLVGAGPTALGASLRNVANAQSLL
jgi:predicted glycosyltransferase